MYIMIPAENPSATDKNFLFVVRNKSTNRPPIPVDNPANKANMSAGIQLSTPNETPPNAYRENLFVFLGSTPLFIIYILP